MDFTYYKTNNTNQYFSMEASAATGYSNYYFNAGDIQNSGFETTMSWRQPITADFLWKTSLNLSYNNNVIKKLDDRQDVAKENRLTHVGLGSLRGYDMRLVEGGSYGDHCRSRSLEKTGSGRRFFWTKRGCHLIAAGKSVSVFA